MAEEEDRSRSPVGIACAGSDITGFDENIIDSHVHFQHHYSGGLQNSCFPNETGVEGFLRDYTEEDYRACITKSGFNVKHAVFVECFNGTPVEEAKWVLSMIDDPKSMVCAITAQISAQKGAVAVNEFLDHLRGEDGSLPAGLKGGRIVFPAVENNSPDACLDPLFHEGLAAVEKAGLHWEFTCNPSMVPNLSTCCAKFPGMNFVVCHLGHNGNDGGEMETWGPAINALAALPNVYCKMGGVEEWDVPNPEEYMDHAIKAFGFDRILYESNWFVNAALGDSYERALLMLLRACLRAGARKEDLSKVFAGNARKVYRLTV